ncbi:MAG: DnaD domain protein [Chloroflexota bacterium]|nr:DnaD domain protein [Chloroflexota bacterium]
MPTRRRQDNIPFAGFVDIDRAAVAIPQRFFTEVLPEITSIGELRVTLTFFRLLPEHGGIEAPVPERTILADRPMQQAFRVDGIPTGDVRQAALKALDRAVARGTLLRVVSRSGRASTVWYFLHTTVTRELVAAIQRGAVAPPKVMWSDDHAPEINTDPPTPFYLYEQNIGPLTPMVADRISRAMDDYPSVWIEDAIAEAVTYNRRSWKYIERILESWSEQGRPDRPS